MRWYLNIEGQNSGPYDDATIVQWIYDGQLTAAWICKEGGNDWVALGAHPPFAEALLAMQNQPAQPEQPAAQAPQAAPPQAAAPTPQAPPAPEMGGAHYISDPASAPPPAQSGAPPAPPPAQGGAPAAPPPGGQQSPAIDHGPLEKDSLGKLIGRIPLLFTSPSQYWDAVAKLRGGFGELLLPTVLLLTGAGALLSMLGSLIAMRRFVGLAPGSMIAGLVVSMLLNVVVSVGLWLLTAVLINAFAGAFDAQKDGDVARKLAFGALTPLWLVSLLAIIPVAALVWILVIAAFGYGCFLLVVGLPRLNGAPEGKAIGYTAAVMGIMLVITLVLRILAACPVGCAAGCAAKASMDRMHRIRRLLRRRGAAPPPKRDLDRGHALRRGASEQPAGVARAARYAPAFAQLAKR